MVRHDEAPEARTGRVRRRSVPWPRLGIALGLLVLSAGDLAARAEMPSAVYPIGQPAAAGEFSVTVLSVEGLAAAGNSRDQATSVRLSVVCVIRNISPRPVPRSRLPRFSLIDPDGVIINPLAASTGRSVAGLNSNPLFQPGESLDLTVPFQAPVASLDRSTWFLLIGGSQGARITLK